MCVAATRRRSVASFQASARAGIARRRAAARYKVVSAVVAVDVAPVETVVAGVAFEAFLRLWNADGRPCVGTRRCRVALEAGNFSAAYEIEGGSVVALKDVAPTVAGDVILSVAVTVEGAEIAAETSVTVEAAAPADLIVAALRSEAFGGEPFRPFGAMKAVDAFGNVVGLDGEVHILAGDEVLGKAPLVGGYCSSDVLVCLERAGDYELSARVVDVALASGNVRVAVRVGPPAALNVRVVETSCIAGAGLPVWVSVVDAGRNVVHESELDVQVVASERGAVRIDFSVTCVDGIATVSNGSLAALTAAGEYTIAFSSEGIAGADVGVVVVPGEPRAFAVDAGDGRAGLPLKDSAPRIRAVDAYGNTAFPRLEPVRVRCLALGEVGPSVVAATVYLMDGTGAVDPSTVISSSAVAGTYRFFASTSLIEGVSGAVTVRAGPPARLVFLVWPQREEYAGALINQQPEIEIVDLGGNRCVDVVDTVRFVFESDGLLVSAIETQCVAGVAAAEDAFLAREPGSYRFVATLGELECVSPCFDVAPRAGLMEVRRQLAATTTAFKSELKVVSTERDALRDAEAALKLAFDELLAEKNALAARLKEEVDANATLVVGRARIAAASAKRHEETVREMLLESQSQRRTGDGPVYSASKARVMRQAYASPPPRHPRSEVPRSPLPLTQLPGDTTTPGPSRRPSSALERASRAYSSSRRAPVRPRSSSVRAASHDPDRPPATRQQLFKE